MTGVQTCALPISKRYMEELAQKEKSATVKDWLGSEHEGSKLYKSLMEQDFTTHEGLDEVERLLNGPDAQLNTRGLKIAEQDIAKHREAIGAQEQQQAAAQQEDETRSSQIDEAANVPGVATPAVPQEHIDTAQAALDTISQAPKLPSATPAPLIRAAKNLGVSVTNMPVAQAIDTVQTRLNELQPQGVSNAPTALTELGRPATGTTGAMGSSGVGSGVGYTAEPAVVERPPVEPAGSNVSDAVRRAGEPNAALKIPPISNEMWDKELSNNQYTTDDSTRGYITYLTPQEFLKLTPWDKEEQSYVKEKAKEHGEFDEKEFNKNWLPTLNVDPSGKVKAHEGRTRAYMAEQAGYDKIPVLVQMPKTDRLKDIKQAPT